MKTIEQVVILLVVVTGAFSSLGEESTRRYLVPNVLAKHLPLKLMISAELKTFNQQHLVKMSPQEVQNFSEAVHKNEHTCGGFIDVDHHFNDYA